MLNYQNYSDVLKGVWGDKRKAEENATVPGSLILNLKNVLVLTLFSMGVGGGGIGVPLCPR